MNMQAAAAPPQMEQYIATRNFKLSNPEIQVIKGMSIYFDGMHIQLDGMPRVPAPNMRGAIRTGWIVRAAEYNENAVQVPVSAGMTIRPADSGNPMAPKPRTPVVTAQEEERHVGNVQSHSQYVQNNNRENYRTAGQRVQNVTAADIQMQDGVPVRQLGRPTVRGEGTNMYTQGNAALRQASNTQVQPGQGRTREDIMAQMTPEQRAQYELEIQARKAQHGILDQQVAIPTVMAGPEHQGTVVAQVRSQHVTQEREGIRTVNEVGGGTETVDLSGTGGRAETRVVEQEGIRFTTTNGPKKDFPQAQPQPAAAPRSLDGDPRRIIATSICPDFPDNYDFDASARKKIARLQADYEDRPDIIKAVAAAETDADVKVQLIKEFPSAFGG